jgi:hypothetical protein
MAGRLDPCFLISLAVDPGALGPLLPAGLDLLTHRGTAFWNIVVCRVRRLRLLGAPGLFGLTYWHVAHRLHVAATARSARRWQGLFFLRSDIDRAILTAPGNWLTDFRFHGVGMRIDERPGWFRLEMGRNDNSLASGSIEIDRNGGAPADSPLPFDSLEEREKILRYTPSGLAVDPAARVLRIAEVDRDERRWRESPVALVHCEFSYLQDHLHGQARVVRATEVAPIDYVWTLGTRVTL